MDTDVDIKSIKSNPATLQIQMNNIMSTVSTINTQIQSLSAKRDELLEKYEKLKEAKEFKERKVEVQHTVEWDKESFPWSTKVRTTMENVFHLTEFRAQQLQTINSVMARKDTLLIVPTGGGKSLCYQLPAVLASNALTIVVSPLISLMEDQVWSLQKLNIEAELLSAAIEKNKNNTILKQIAETGGPCPFRILYVTPERLAKSKRFMNALQKCYLAKKLHMIAVDEVHCCSQWGHDFRPDYKFLGVLKSMFPDVPILGTTATATTQVIQDVQKMLNLASPIILKAEFNRPNLYYHVLEKPSDKEQCIELIANLLKTRYANQSGIIYTFSISDTEELAAALVDRELKVRPYHATLQNQRRTKIHSDWLSGRIQVVVATVAFGMGIDKPDVRFVIHHTLSKSMENFYQESGRAGRDGKRAECILLYRCPDTARITTMMFTEHTGLKNAYNMVEYAIDGISCRRDMISKHFMDVWSDRIECNRMCDRCFFKDAVYPPKMIITEHCLNLYKIIDHAHSLDVRLTFLKLVDAWYHKGKSNLRLKTIPAPEFDRFHAEQMIIYLILKNYLKEDFHFSTYTTISYIKQGGKIASENDRIIFHASRVLDLPTVEAIERNNSVAVVSSTPSERSRSDSYNRPKSVDRASVISSISNSSQRTDLNQSKSNHNDNSRHHSNSANSETPKGSQRSRNDSKTSTPNNSKDNRGRKESVASKRRIRKEYFSKRNNSKRSQNNSIGDNSKPSRNNSIGDNSKRSRNNSIGDNSKPSHNNSIGDNSKPSRNNSIGDNSKRSRNNSIGDNSKPSRNIRNKLKHSQNKSRTEENSTFRVKSEKSPNPNTSSSVSSNFDNSKEDNPFRKHKYSNEMSDNSHQEKKRRCQEDDCVVLMEEEDNIIEIED